LDLSPCSWVCGLEDLSIFLLSVVLIETNFF
jgi:hypothetical protein